MTFQATCTSSNGGVTGTASGASSPITVSSITNGKAYTCTVVTSHVLGTSAPSSASPSIVVGVPGTPLAPSSVVQGNGQATVTWAAPAANGAPLSAYVITPYIGTTAQTALLAPASSTTATVGSLTNGATYTFRVTAANSYGLGGQSPSSASVVVGTAAAPPTASATPGNGIAALSWTAPNTNGSAITGYQITTIKDGVAQAPQLIAGTGTTKSMTGLTNGATYTFAVAAVNARGTGPATQTAPIIVGTPTAPPLVTATGGAGSGHGDVVGVDEQRVGAHGLHRDAGEERGRAVADHGERHDHDPAGDRAHLRRELRVPGRGHERSWQRSGRSLQRGHPDVMSAGCRCHGWCRQPERHPPGGRAPRPVSPTRT